VQLRLVISDDKKKAEKENGSTILFFERLT
jgi:hypothetical protein